MEKRDQEYIRQLLWKYRQGVCDADEFAELLGYLREKQVSRVVLEDMEEAFQESMEHPALLPEEVSRRMRQRLAESIPGKRGTLRKWVFWPAAAVLTLLLGCWFLLLRPASAREDWQRVVTEAGTRREVLLPDSSLVFLNGDSEIRFPAGFSSRQRLIYLRGEAFFEVRPDPARPLFVVGRDFTTKVLGTSFNIDTEVAPSVSVQSGRVQVLEMGEKEVDALMGNRGLKAILAPHRFPEEAWDRRARQQGRQILLEARERAVFVRSGMSWQKEEGVEAGDWRSGALSFYGQAADIIARQLSRYYGTDITVSDSLRGCELTISVKGKSLEQVLQTLAILLKGKPERRKEGWHLSGEGCHTN